MQTAASRGKCVWGVGVDASHSLTHTRAAMRSASQGSSKDMRETLSSVHLLRSGH